MYQQMDIFDFIDTRYKIRTPIRLIELFAGIGSQAKALKNIGANFEHYRVVEWDKYAIKSYNAVHGTNFETSDITKVHASDLGIEDTKHFTYIMTYSFPCQDLSLAGHGKGMEKGSGTRSGLLWEVERILYECDELPQVLLMENVPQVHNKKNVADFEQWINSLKQLGYTSFWQDLNAKDYGIPQNRNRCFMVSILGDYTYEFPEPFPLEKRLKDMLEDEVDEKYYLSEETIKYLEYGEYRSAKVSEKLKRTESGICPTLDTMQDGHRQPFIAIKNATKKGYLEAYEGDGVDISSRMQYHRGTVQSGMIQTLDTQQTKGVVVCKAKEH